MIKTYYPQWGEFTAFNAFLKYFDTRQFRIKMINTPMGEGSFPSFIPFLKKAVRKRISAKGVQEYKLNDLQVEYSMFWKSLFKKVDIIHFLDAEHSLMFLPSWYKNFRFLKTPPKIIGMFHQPPSVLDTIINIDIVKELDQVQVVSPVQARYFEKFLPSERIKTILLGVDTQHFKPVLKPKNSKNFRCLGGGLWLRDYDALIRTANLLSENPDIEFHVVAEKQNGYPDLDNVFYYQTIPDEDLFNLYQNCDILFLPMQDATANTFLLEGCACGLPVVSSDLESIRNYFPGEEAILVKNNDPEVFASTIVELKKNSLKRSKMSECARKRALDLSWEKVVKEHEILYLELC